MDTEYDSDEAHKDSEIAAWDSWTTEEQYRKGEDDDQRS